ncbi:MAG: HPr family phosphocarrier protein [Candidatus Adiutrix sp.]|jgi:phosphocarrier protein|nr:HPr family phosphocarrier protein [Candidatus Adiutrix sp.]
MRDIESRSMELIIKNRLGLHARAAAKLVRAAGEYQATIKLVKDGQAADARSVLSLISLGCAYDSKVTVHAEGIDAEGAVSALREIIENRFGEE